jgi:transcriptional regulator CtsR
MKRIIVIEPYGYDFIRATLYRKGGLFRRVEQRTHMHEAYIDQLNQTVEYWRQAKEMQKSQIIHRGFDNNHSIFTEAFFFLRGLYFKKLLASQIKYANALCRLTKRKTYVVTDTRGFPRVIQSRQIPMLKKQGFIKKDASALDFDRECLYKVEYKDLEIKD